MKNWTGRRQETYLHFVLLATIFLWPIFRTGMELCPPPPQTWSFLDKLHVQPPNSNYFKTRMGLEVVGVSRIHRSPLRPRPSSRPLVVGERCYVLGPGNKWIDAFITGITDSGRSYDTQVEATGGHLTRNRSHIKPRSADIPMIHASFLQSNSVPSGNSDRNPSSTCIGLECVIPRQKQRNCFREGLFSLILEWNVQNWLRSTWKRDQ